MAKVSVGSPNTCVTSSFSRNHGSLTAFYPHRFERLRMGVAVIDLYLPP